MAKILDAYGNELSGTDKGLLGLLGSCGDLTYLERKMLKEILMPQFLDVELTIGHPSNVRFNELKVMLKEATRARARKQRYGKKLKPTKRGDDSGADNERAA